MNYIHIDLRFGSAGEALGCSARRRARGRGVGQAQYFQGIDEVVFIERIHNGQKRIVIRHNV